MKGTDIITVIHELGKEFARNGTTAAEVLSRFLGKGAAKGSQEGDGVKRLIKESFVSKYECVPVSKNYAEEIMGANFIGGYQIRSIPGIKFPRIPYISCSKEFLESDDSKEEGKRIFETHALFYFYRGLWDHLNSEEYYSYVKKDEDSSVPNKFSFKKYMGEHFPRDGWYLMPLRPRLFETYHFNFAHKKHLRASLVLELVKYILLSKFNPEFLEENPKSSYFIDRFENGITHMMDFELGDNGRIECSSFAEPQENVHVPMSVFLKLPIDS